MTTYVFQEVKWREQRKLKCRSCGKRFTRSRTFTQTVNPFNKNADGVPKNYGEVYRSVVAEGKAWQPADLCGTCEDAP